jgi:hypothetical protein
MIFQNFGFNQNYPVAVAGTDPNAQAFITATGISGSNATAINTLVLDLKSAGVWTKLIAAYPFIGGTADSNKYNLMNPVNSDAAFRLTYTSQAGTSITHSASGFEVKNNTTNGAYAVTYLSPSTTGSLTSQHMSLYVNSNNTQTVSDSVQAGAFVTNGLGSVLMMSKSPSTSNKFIARLENDPLIQGSTSTTEAGFYVATRNATTGSLYRNGGAAEATVSTTAGTLPNINIWIGCLNFQNSVYGPVWSTFAWFSYGAGLSATETADMYTAIQTYQTTLGRQV